MNVYSAVKSAGIAASPALNASTYTTLNAQQASRVILANTASGAVAIQVKQDASTAAITVPAATSFTFAGIRDTSQLSLLAASGTPTVTYRWEH